MKEQTMPLTREVAAWIAQVSFGQIPSDVIKPIKDSVIDTIGCAILGSTSSFAKLLRDYIVEWKTTGESVIWGTDKKASIPFAAMANSAASHAWDFDDSTLPGIMHPGGVTISTGLAIAENKKVNGRDFLAALVAGYEVSNLIGVALGSKKFVSTGFYNSVPVIFASVTVAGKLLDLDEEKLKDALGLAATQAAGLYSATLQKRINSPKAVLGGIFAVELARRGLEGPPDPLEADYSGFLTTFSDEPQMDVISRDIGNFSFEVFHKYYPCIRSNQPAVEAVKLMRHEYPDVKADKIDKIIVHTDKTTIEYTVNTTGGGTIVQTLGNALISLPYCVAAMLVDGELTLEQFTEEKIKNPIIQELLKKVELVHDPEIDKLPATQRYRCTVEIKLKDGKTYSKFLAGPKGDPTNRLTREDMYNKFMKNVTTVFAKDRGEELFKTLEGIEELDDVGKIANLLLVGG